ncbi:SDR family oxidoreductase [Salinimicrobium oceani]|uniref:SDR family oxidoreductase n=1 Tax=Salinimicrobium oceani TaxID=2722702 RepID=A0ABX1CUA6_9FLAO|nr:SDR family oxidoreductase [Salinimicrobium oceani]NJW51874.1 SDR family oxidoreductase [Salinimicrobium oceani]
MWNLKGQTAVITGGSKGIGRATVSEFLKLGAEVLYTGRNADDILKVEDEFTAAGHSVKGIVADVTKAEDRRKVFSWAENNWKAVTIVVNNAGINIRKKATEISEEEHREVLETNLIAPFLLAKELYPFLKQSGNGKIINVASAAAMQDVGTGTPYAMAKAGLLQQTRSLAVEWARDNIRVNAVSPWYTRTPLTDSLLEGERKEMILRRTPLNRIAEPEEIASIIAFLAMDNSSFITGQNIIADGGMSVKAL